MDQLLDFWNMYASGNGGMPMGGKGGKGFGFVYDGGKSGFGYDGWRPTLDEKYFRHIAPYHGDNATHRTYVTDVVVAVARLDGRLARALRKILMEPDENMKMDEKEWEAVRDGGSIRMFTKGIDMNCLDWYLRRSGGKQKR